MSSLAALSRRLARLGEISSVMAAMKNLALVESRKLARCAEAQQRMQANIEAALADFLAFHPQPGVVSGPSLLVVIGSERGFCGNFNARLRAAVPGENREERPILVGQRLAARWPEGTEPPLVVAGATVTEEIPAVLARLLAAIQSAAGGRIAILAHDGGEITLTPVLPLPPPAAPCWRQPPRLQLPPAELFAALLDQYLPAVLERALSASLAAENRQRLTHMENALDRLDETLAALTLKKNALRQEQIVEEIEVMLSGR